MHRLVILGGGTAGTMAANMLRKRLSRHQWQITIVDRDDEHHYQPGYLFIPFGTYRREQVVRSRHAFIRDGIELVLSAIDTVDASARTVHLDDGRTLNYDLLIVATGCEPRPDQTPGLADALNGPAADRAVHEFYTLPGALGLHEALKRFTGGHLVVQLTELPIKCPVAPLEFAFLAEDHLSRRGLGAATRITYVTPLDGAFTKATCSRALSHLLDDRDISLETDFMTESVELSPDGPARGVLRSYDDREIPFDMLVTVPVNMGQKWVARSGLGDDLNFIPTDKHTLRSRDHDDIWVLGDASDIPTSKAGSVAHFACETLVDNIVAQISGTKLPSVFDGHANCFIETGRGKALLIDFNYDVEPLPGTFPIPAVGPMRLLTETRANHAGKMAFRHIYWNVLLPGRTLPIGAHMSMAGKKPLAVPPEPTESHHQDGPAIPTF
ncbi:Sulfide-quinone reductase [Austwickia sp. TVS 96-490-7B]|uniref:type III sulfide quinone reductase, selenoprotein subtype n=1 Tax=Austwickia sp. TVS 96-490-7B TaxID=2830843 RepID=UPI001C57D46A|nr:FAD/NAD(P)-binding oxidoreductase [Austwickia sp. TVS 96-490-7B]MBW3085233.1 Sulfide-quinone reductase [Austwickia sp. TVS 96-490-7B]